MALKILHQVLMFLSSVFLSEFLAISVNNTSIYLKITLIICFYVMFFIINLLVQKKIRPKIKEKIKASVLIPCLIIAVIIGGNIVNVIQKSYLTIADVEIVATGEKNKNALGNEVLILQILVDEKEFDLSSIPTTEEIFLVDGVLAFQPSENPTKLNLSFNAKNVSIAILRHPWSGIVEINGIKTDLYDEEGLRYNTQQEIQGVEKPTSIILSISSIVFVFWFLYNLVLCSIYNKKIGYITYICIMLFSVFVFSSNYLQTIFWQIFSIILSIIFAILSAYAVLEEKMFSSFKDKIIIIIISVLVTFIFTGRKLFMYKPFIIFDRYSVFTFLVYSLGAVIFISASIYLINFASKKINHRQNKENKYSWWIFFFIMFSVTMVLVSGYYPAIMTIDSIVLWQTINGVSNHNPAVPFAHTLLIQFISKIWNNPFMVVIVQALSFSALLATILNFLYKKGFSYKFLLVFAAIFPLFPNNFLTILLISKNVPYALGLLWLTYLIIRVLDNRGFIKKPINILAFALSHFLIYEMRLNGKFIVFGLIITLIYVTVKFWKEIKLFFLIPLLVSAVFIGFTETVIKNQIVFNGDSHGMFYAGPLYTPFGAAIANDVELSDETYEWMEEVAPLEYWKTTYSGFHRDYFTWGSALPTSLDVDATLLFKEYLKLLVKRPDIVIRDRLDGANMIWDADSPSVFYTLALEVNAFPEDMFEYTPVLNELQTQGKLYFDPPLKKIGEAVTAFVYQNTFLQTIVWENGFYLALFLIFIGYSIMKKDYRMIFASFPFLIMLATLTLTIGWQIYQYIWFSPLCILMLISYSLTEESSLDKETKRDEG